MDKKKVPDFYMTEAELAALGVKPVFTKIEQLIEQQQVDEMLEDALNEAWINTKH